MKTSSGAVVSTKNQKLTVSNEFLEGTKRTWLGYVYYIGPLVRTFVRL